METNDEGVIGAHERALHEAGHAVALERLPRAGSRVDVVTIVPHGDFGGLCISRDRRDEQDDISRRDQRIVSCSGYAALIVAGFPEADAEWGATYDFLKVRARCSELDLEEHKAAAVRFLSRPDIFREVLIVADALLERRTLLGSEMRELMGDEK